MITLAYVILFSTLLTTIVAVDMGVSGQSWVSSLAMLLTGRGSFLILVGAGFILSLLLDYRRRRGVRPPEELRGPS